MKKFIALPCLALALWFNSNMTVAQDAADAANEQNTSYSLGMKIADNVRSILPGWTLDSVTFADGVNDTISGNELRLDESEINKLLQETNTAKGQPQPKGLDVLKFSYALGAFLGGQLFIDPKDLLMPHFLSGVREQLDGKAKLGNEESDAYVQAYIAKVEKRQQELAKLAKKKNREFFVINGKQPGVKSHRSGIQYQVIQAGTGAQPNSESSVTVHYTGTLLDGTEFDSSRGRGEPISFPLNGVIQGWQIALPLMKTGAIWKIWLPSELAYGSRGSPPNIGPDQALVFEIELIAIK